MREPKSAKAAPAAPAPWQVPVAVENVAETGRHFDLMADADVRAAVARTTGLRDLPRLEASFDVTRHGVDGLHVVGHVAATVGQNCVVTLEPLENALLRARYTVLAQMATPDWGDMESPCRDPGAPAIILVVPDLSRLTAVCSCGAAEITNAEVELATRPRGSGTR